MKKCIYVIILALSLLSCVQNNNNSKDNIIKSEPLLYVFIDSLLKENPNMMNNEITKQDFEILLKSEIQEYREDSLPFLNELPLKFEMALEYPEYDKNNGKYVVKFGLSSSRSITLQVFAIVEKSFVTQLVEGELYNISGLFKDFANCKGSFTLPSGGCFEGFPVVSGSGLNKSPYIDLGTFILENLTFAKAV